MDTYNSLPLTSHRPITSEQIVCTCGHLLCCRYSGDIVSVVNTAYTCSIPTEGHHDQLTND